MATGRRAGICAVAALLAAGGLAAAGRADAPGNDAQSGAVALDATRGAVAGTTQGATVAKTDPATVCDEPLSATLWYSLADVPPRDVVLRLSAQPGLTAVVAVYRVRNGRLSQIDCGETADDGVVTLGISAVAGDLVLVGETATSPAGAFTLAALQPALPERVPGRALHGVARGAVEEYLDESDLWHVGLRAGTTYRISFVDASPDACPNVRLYRPGGPPDDSRSVLYLRCNAAASFTPGPDGGGRYLLLVDIGYASGRVPYRLEVAPAAPDDTAPGLALAPGAWRSGRLDPRAADQLDMYRFDLAARSDVTIQLGRPWAKHVSLLLLRESGRSVAAGRAIRRQLAAGTYFAVVQAPAGTAPAAYRLLLRERGTSTLTAEGLQDGDALVGSPLLLTVSVGRPAGRSIVLEVDRFDPLAGWLYERSFRVRVDRGAEATLRWPARRVGAYRFRVTAPGRSGYVYATVRDRP